ncbi:MAG: beta-ketoacyl-ACP synthase 3 [Oscillospiraceae bacterium]|nr:beta-ketoacyl-ACP synthase 3 [Oscillospiraceae bacterium]
MSLKIIGMGKSIPRRRVTNDDIASFVDTSNEWIVSRTGIEARHVCTDEMLTDLAVIAAKQAIASAGLVADDVDMIVGATLGGDYRTPSLASCVSEQLNAKAPAFDINAACTGFIYALDVAAGFLATGRAKNILIICAEQLSACLDWSDRNTCILFGDGAAACVVTHGDSLQYINLSPLNGNAEVLHMAASTNASPFINSPRDNGCIYMQGQEVFKFAVNAVENELTQALGALKISADEIDYFVLHQANKRIIDSARLKVKQPKEKFPLNIDKYGNISSVSVPLLLCEMLEEEKLNAGDKLFLAAFGAGMTAGSAVLEWV